MSVPRPDSPPRGALLVVFLVVFVDLLGFGIVLPLLPRIAQAYLPTGLSPLASGLLIGVLYSSFSLMQFLFAPAWGRLSDRVGRRPVLLVGLAGSVACYALFGYASRLDPATSGGLALTLLILSRAGAGICGATVAVAQAVIADCTTREGRSRGMALVGAAFGIGFTFGPLIAYAAMVYRPDDPGAVGFLASAISAVALLLCWRLLPETGAIGQLGEHRSILSVSRLVETLGTPGVGRLVLIFFLATFAFACFEGTLSLFTTRFGYTDADNYLVFAFVGAVLMVANGVVYRRLAKTVPEAALLRAGVVMMLVGLGGLAYLATAEGLTRVTFYSALALSVFGFAFMTPSSQSLISKAGDPARQGEVLGVNQSFAALARILGPTLGLALLPLTAAPVLPYAAAAALLSAAGALSLRLGSAGSSTDDQAAA